jgi:ribosomal protein L25 (general stress protein Ctc)
MLWPAVLQGGFNMATAGLNNIFNRRAQNRQWRENRRQAEVAYGRDLEMWNRQTAWNREMWDLQNEYNLPSAQMDRLRKAGLNPNLMYGNASAGGQAGAIQQATMPKYQSARANYSYVPAQVPQILGMYQDFKLKNAQMDLLKEQAITAREKGLTEAALRSGKRIGLTHSNAIKYSQAKYAQAFNKLELETGQQRLKNLGIDHRLKELDIPYRQARSGLKGIEYDWLKNRGVRPQDALWMRLLMNAGEGIMDSNLMRGLLESFKNSWRYGKYNYELY